MIQSILQWYNESDNDTGCSDYDTGCLTTILALLQRYNLTEYGTVYIIYRNDIGYWKQTKVFSEWQKYCRINFLRTPICSVSSKYADLCCFLLCVHIERKIICKQKPVFCQLKISRLGCHVINRPIDGSTVLYLFSTVTAYPKGH